MDLIGVNEEVRDEEVERSLSLTVDPEKLSSLRAASTDFLSMNNNLSTIFPSFPKRKTTEINENESFLHSSQTDSYEELSKLDDNPLLPNLTQKNKKKTIFFVLIVTFNYYIVAMLITTLIPALFLDLTDDNSSQASSFNGIAAFLRNFFQFLFAPSLGYICDRYGRKVVLYLGLTVNILCCLLFYTYPTVYLIFFIHIMLGKNIRLIN